MKANTVNKLKLLLFRLEQKVHNSRQKNKPNQKKNKQLLLQPFIKDPSNHNKNNYLHSAPAVYFSSTYLILPLYFIVCGSTGVDNVIYFLY